MTFTEYLKQVRMEKAKELLSDPYLPIKQVRAQVGYTHVPSFDRDFKRLVGMTPSEYRRRVSDITRPDRKSDDWLTNRTIG
jgi:YesN/AraC family two-component response regulator